MKRTASISMGIFGMLYLACSGGACGGGETGRDGAPGAPGSPGANGTGGTPGSNGQPGSNGERGARVAGLGGNKTRAPGIDPATPLSAVVAVSLVAGNPSAATDIPTYVRALTTRFAQGKLTSGDDQFPVVAAATDTFRALEGLAPSVLVKWLDRLSFTSPTRFGANADYIAYFGDQWNANPANAPQWAGRGDAGWHWVNHE
ncbi:MAG TPA: collagen-like protein [Labilithrix sp.]|nr:collagen-like protein [Labilithrix sp.]